MPTLEEIFDRARTLTKDQRLVITCETPKKAKSKRTMLYRMKVAHQEHNIFISIKDATLTLYKEKPDDCVMVSLSSGEHESISKTASESKESHISRLTQEYLSQREEILANSSISQEEKSDLLMDAKLPLDQALSYYNKLERIALASKKCNGSASATLEKDKLIDEPSIFPREEINYDALIREETLKLKEKY